MGAADCRSTLESPQGRAIQNISAGMDVEKFRDPSKSTASKNIDTSFFTPSLAKHPARDQS
jgi:hypothetical protein